MKLVNIHKPCLVLLLIVIGFQSAQAQVWSLQQCIDTAQVYNKKLQVNRNDIAIGEQREKEAKANLYPKVTANADYKYFYEDKNTTTDKLILKNEKDLCNNYEYCCEKCYNNCENYYYEDLRFDCKQFDNSITFFGEYDIDELLNNIDYNLYEWSKEEVFECVEGNYSDLVDMAITKRELIEKYFEKIPFGCKVVDKYNIEIHI